MEKINVITAQKNTGNTLTGITAGIRFLFCSVSDIIPQLTGGKNVLKILFVLFVLFSAGTESLSGQKKVLYTQDFDSLYVENLVGVPAYKGGFYVICDKLKDQNCNGIQAKDSVGFYYGDKYNDLSAKFLPKGWTSNPSFTGTPPSPKGWISNATNSINPIRWPHYYDRSPGLFHLSCISNYNSDSATLIFNGGGVCKTSKNTNITVQWGARRRGKFLCSFYYSKNNGTSWKRLNFAEVPNDGNWYLVKIGLPVDSTGGQSLQFKWRYKASDGTKSYRIDDFSVIETPICYWNGSTDKVWNTAANWSKWNGTNGWKNETPDDGADVIFSTVANHGSDAQNDLVLDGVNSIGNLINATGKRLIVQPGTVANKSSLTVNGTVTVTPNSEDRILIRAGGNGNDPDSVNGSFILNNPRMEINPTVKATVQMYSKAFLPSGKTRYKWQYAGIPVITISNPSTAFTGIYKIRKWNEPNYSWDAVSDYTTLKSSEGFEMAQNTAATYTLKGILETDSITKTGLTKTTTYAGSTADAGYHLLANPYTSAIKINKIQMGSGMDSTVYLYYTGSHEEWANLGGLGQTSPTTGDINTPGQYIAVPLRAAGLGNPALPSEISSMQGFFVHVKTTAKTPIVNIYYPNYPNVPNVRPMRAKHAASETETEILPHLTMTVTGTDGSDRIWIFRENSTTSGYENGWDAYKWEGSAGLPQMYVATDSGNLQVSTSSEIPETYLSFRAGNGDGNYTLTINNGGMTTYYPALALIDLIDNTRLELNQAVNTYTFTATNTSSFDKRFLLTERTNVITGIEKSVKTRLNIYCTNNLLKIQNPTNESGIVHVFDIAGKQVLKGIYLQNRTTEINTNLSAGIYFVKVKSESINQSEKIMIRY